MEKLFFALAGIFGALGVSLGAFGAHALKSRLASEMLTVYQTGVQYHLVHAVALGLCAVAAGKWPGSLTTASGWLFATGIVLFSGSLYVLTTTGLRQLGMITPVGGVAFIAGWVSLALAALRN